MHYCYKNHKYQYTLGIDMLNVSLCEKVFGILIDDKFSFKDHVYMSVKKASQMCTMILAMYIILKIISELICIKHMLGLI